MKKKKTKGSKGGILAILFILVILILAFGIYIFVSNKNGMERILGKVDEKQATLTEYIVYGTHLNIKGEVKTETTGIKGVNLVLATTDEDEKKIKLKFEFDGDLVKFHTSDLINMGIDLEGMAQNKYYILIEVEYEKVPKYFSINNSTEYGEVVYYTITKNNVNYKIDIDFDTYKKDEKSISYMFMDVKPSHLPKDVYDVVIDPGHGGADNGAEGGGYTESELTLEYGNMVKTELEKLGLKVKMTRNRNRKGRRV